MEKKLVVSHARFRVRDWLLAEARHQIIVVEIVRVMERASGWRTGLWKVKREMSTTALKVEQDGMVCFI